MGDLLGLFRVLLLDIEELKWRFAFKRCTLHRSCRKPGPVFPDSQS